MLPREKPSAPAAAAPGGGGGGGPANGKSPMAKLKAAAQKVDEQSGPDSLPMSAASAVGALTDRVSVSQGLFLR